ncbi:hypothetical protein [Mulberry dwarf phytoplasma]|uniref:hypothetical protein n=1 Tax=Mulberry dwarf phytoplasma TaxID=186171 RepID=UPI001D10F54A|nr:hypothetical protein [Mulberry dwarf phytoplasma]
MTQQKQKQLSCLVVIISGFLFVLLVILIIDPFGWFKKTKTLPTYNPPYPFVAPETFSLDCDKLNVEQTINKVNDILEKNNLDNEIIQNNFNEIPKNKLETDYLERIRKDYIGNKQVQNKKKIENLKTENNQKVQKLEELNNQKKPLEKQELEAKSQKTQLENKLETLKNENTSLQGKITNWRNQIKNEPSSSNIQEQIRNKQSAVQVNQTQINNITNNELPPIQTKITNLQESLSPLVKEYKHLIEEKEELESQIECLKKFNKKLESFDIYQYSEKPQNHFKKCQTCQQWKNCIDSEFETTFYPMVKKERDALLFQATLIKTKYLLLAIKKISKYYFELKHLLDYKKEEIKNNYFADQNSILYLENTFYQTQYHLISLMSMLKGIEEANKGKKPSFEYDDLFSKTVRFLNIIDSLSKDESLKHQFEKEEPNQQKKDLQENKLDKLLQDGANNRYLPPIRNPQEQNEFINNFKKIFMDEEFQEDESQPEPAFIQTFKENQFFNKNKSESELNNWDTIKKFNPNCQYLNLDQYCLEPNTPQEKDKKPYEKFIELLRTISSQGKYTFEIQI